MEPKSLFPENMGNVIYQAVERGIAQGATPVEITYWIMNYVVSAAWPEVCEKMTLWFKEHCGDEALLKWFDTFDSGRMVFSVPLRRGRNRNR